jgi:hypothetical protein
MNLVKSLKNVAIAALLFSAGVAHAAVYQYQLTGDYTASWQLNSATKPNVNMADTYFGLYDVKGNFPGSAQNLADLYFYNGEQLGGLGISDFSAQFDLLMTAGPQLYSGSENNPTFLLGTFNLTDLNGSGTYVLTVTDLDATPPGTVPEPATAAMLIAGLGLFAASRKRFKA